MADVEFHVPTPSHEPTFIKPLDTASRRRSRASHESAAASTRSWVLMNQHSPPPPAEPIPIPDPIPALAPTTPVSRASRPLPEPPRRTSAINIEEEHMSVEVPPMGYQWESRRAPKQREVPTHKGFVGGFVSGLRRLPRALVRTRRSRPGPLHAEEETEGTEQTGATGNTLPRYVSNPTTPVVPNTTVPFTRNADADMQLRHPSFRIHPPEEDVGQGADAGDAQQQQRGGRDPTMVEFPETPLENPYDREATSVHDTPLAAPSLHPSRADDHLAVHPTELDNDEPVSVRAHPLPTADYRRMSAADAAQPQSRRTTISSGSFSSGSPSFSAELNVNGISRFLNALHLLPWVAAERITADYEPKERSRPAISWYYPKGESDARRAVHATASPASPASPTRPHTRSPPRHRTHHRRASTPPITASAPPTAPAFPIAYPYYPAFSPSPPPPSPPPSQVPRSHRRPSPPPRRTTARSSHRHHRRSAAYHSPQPVSMSMPAPWGSPSLLPAPPPPIYIVQASPAPTLAMPSPPPPAAVAMPPPAPPSSGQGTSGSAQGTPGSGFGSPAAQPLPHAHPSPRSDRSGGSGSGSGKAHPQMFGLGLTPVYMQMQVVPLSPSPSPAPPGSPQPQQVALVAGDARYGYSYPYGYGVGIGAPAAYTGGWNGSVGSAGTGSPIAMPPPVQTAGR